MLNPTGTWDGHQLTDPTWTDELKSSFVTLVNKMTCPDPSSRSSTVDVKFSLVHMMAGVSEPTEDE